MARHRQSGTGFDFKKIPGNDWNREQRGFIRRDDGPVCRVGQKTIRKRETFGRRFREETKRKDDSPSKPSHQGGLKSVKMKSLQKNTITPSTGEGVYHIPALLTETIEGLNIKPDGVYVDVTFGGGGHSREILMHLGVKGRLFGFDQDEDALQNVINDERFTFVRSNFRYLSNFLK